MQSIVKGGGGGPSKGKTSKSPSKMRIGYLGMPGTHSREIVQLTYTPAEVKKLQADLNRFE